MASGLFSSDKSDLSDFNIGLIAAMLAMALLHIKSEQI